MHRLIKGAVAVAVAGGMAFTVASCEDKPTAKEQESTAQQNNYSKLVANEPAKSMDTSPTRKTINKWIETWGKDPNKVSYVYLQNAKGEYGYFVIKGLPVSYCAMLTPSYELIGTPDDGSSARDQQVPAPGMDGAYYSGGQCDQYYAIDATTGAYLEWSIGTNQSYFLYDQPMQLPEFRDANPMGPTTIEEAKKVDDGG